VIPLDYITEWRQEAPWVQDAQVEQDLVISRALVHLFQQEEVSRRLAFRGGTALYKLYLSPPSRYSEDIDLVQMLPGTPGLLIDSMRSTLDPWLGTPRRIIKESKVALLYGFRAEAQPSIPLRLKIEINTSGQFSIRGLVRVPFEVQSRWFRGGADMVTYDLEELLSTKLRAPYQRKESRDLSDLWDAWKRAKPDSSRMVACFLAYVERSGLSISRAEFEANLREKMKDPDYSRDLEPLLAPGTVWHPQEAADYILRELLPLLPGDPLKGGR
jgi:predicted nucleotidyltransferase component of viral defense system